MAVFGLPGGAEWLIIAVTFLLLFVPGLALVGLGYVLGRHSAGARHTDGAGDGGSESGNDGEDGDVTDG